MSQTSSFRPAFDCLPGAAWLGAQNVPAHIRAQVFTANSREFFDVGAVFSGNAGALPGLDDPKAFQAHGAGQRGHAAGLVNGAIQRTEGGVFHAPIIDSKSSAGSLSIHNIGRMTIHNRIRVGREAMKLTAQEFADRLGVTRGAVQQWEKAKGTAPSRKHQGAVAALLGITVPELMNPDPNPREVQSPAAPVAGQEPSENARVLAQLYDMLPDDLIKRTEAYNAATAEIIAVLQGRPRQHSPAPSDTPEPQKSPEKQRA